MPVSLSVSPPPPASLVVFSSLLWFRFWFYKSHTPLETLFICAHHHFCSPVFFTLLLFFCNWQPSSLSSNSSLEHFCWSLDCCILCHHFYNCSRFDHLQHQSPKPWQETFADDSILLFEPNFNLITIFRQIDQHFSFDFLRRTTSWVSTEMAWVLYPCLIHQVYYLLSWHLYPSPFCYPLPSEPTMLPTALELPMDQESWVWRCVASWQPSLKL